MHCVEKQGRDAVMAATVQKPIGRQAVERTREVAEVLPRLEEVGDRVLWGTDWPSPGVSDLRSNAEVFCAQDHWSDAFKQAVLVDNPARLFPPRAG